MAYIGWGGSPNLMGFYIESKARERERANESQKSWKARTGTTRISEAPL